ncbi:MAG TPA: hypothetical protein VF727_10730 [Allosphingosinicella sp.]|jgi:hypothetical protein
MASASVERAATARTSALLAACVAEQGSAPHPYALAAATAGGPHAARDLADLLHFLCTLHGRYPGIVDQAALRVVDPPARAWLTNAGYAFAGERAYLARIAAAAGPVPSTPGAAESDAAVHAQRHAIDLLAQSERSGCALGAAMAVVLDWAVIRRALDAAAQRFGLEAPPYERAGADAVATVADACASSPSVQRAMLFGAQQLAVQHYGLWDLLEARHQARGDS